MSIQWQNQTKTTQQTSFVPVSIGFLQRKCACGQHTIAGSECEECHQKKREGTLQRAAVNSAPTNGVPPIVHDVLNSSGQPLDTGTRAFMEPRFGYDFSRVRVHTDARAAESARSVNALAYTVGRDVVFGTGQYAPNMSEGRRLMAHELTHVVQQQSSGTSPNANLRVNEAHDVFEKEADVVTNHISANGLYCTVSQTGGLQVQRNGNSTENQIPAWTRNQLKAIQVQLKRLGLYQDTIDKIFGPDTESGLVEAFSGNEWRTMLPNKIILRLTKAKAVTGRRGEHKLRYGEMFKDGLLDMTLGIGFDENTKAMKQDIIGMKKELLQHDFKDDSATAMQIYKKFGRFIDNRAFVMYFVLQHPLQYTPPAGATRQVQVVVRLISNTDEKHGGEAATVFKEGMRQSDVAYYAGHGRYGSGPDFDRNMTFELLNADGTVDRPVSNYEDLEKILEAESRSHDPWKQFLWRVNHHRIKVIGFNAGNIYLNYKMMEHEFGAKLMYWNLNRVGAGAPLVTGRTGELAAPSKQQYRLLVFDGCRTKDYLTSIRKISGYDSKSTDIIDTKRTVDSNDDVRTLAAFLSTILKQQSAEQIIRDMDAQNITERKTPSDVAIKGEGFEDNPVIR